MGIILLMCIVNVINIDKVTICNRKYKMKWGEEGQSVKRKRKAVMLIW